MDGLSITVGGKSKSIPFILFVLLFIFSVFISIEMLSTMIIVNNIIYLPTLTILSLGVFTLLFILIITSLMLALNLDII